MKTNEPRDDEILGRALSRAIETAEVNETPYESSRMATRSPKRGTSFWRVSALAASIVIAGALGSTLLERPATNEPVGQQPSPTVTPTHTQAAAASPTPTSTPQPNAIDHQRVFVGNFVADYAGVPPGSLHLDGVGSQSTAEERIRSRMDALNAATSGVGGTQLQADPKEIHVAYVRIQGDTATVDYALPSSGWPMRGAAATLAWQQKLVYTATEEPGIRRLVVTENGGKPTTIDQIVWDKPIAREDVAGYGALKSEVVTETQSRPCAPACPSPVPARLSNNFSVDSFARGVARFVVQVDSGDWESFTVSGQQADDTKAPWSSKYVIQIKIKGTEIKPGLEIVDYSPLRSIQTVTTGGSTTYELAVDDGRPWRVALLANPDRVIVDIGGIVSSISDTVAVYQPTPILEQGPFVASQRSVGRQFTVSGLSRTFEATTAWRVVDSARRVLASGFTTASRGTSAVWGTYQIPVQLPATVSGNVTLEVYWASPRDGSDVDVVQVPLVVR